MAKGTKEKLPNSRNPNERPTVPPLSAPGRCRVVPLGEVLVRRSLPASHEMVDTDMPPADNEGACIYERAAGWQQRTRAVERFENLVFGENSCC